MKRSRSPAIRFISNSVLPFGLVLGLAGCGQGSDGGQVPGSGGTGGRMAGTGGALSTGGTTLPGTGGALSTGGQTATGGAGHATGGATGTGGTGAGNTATGATGAMAGRAGTGGASATGGGKAGGANGTASGGDSGNGTFSKPQGKIANSAQPASTVNLPKTDWQKGLVSPTMLATHHLNQPAVINGYLLVAGNEEFWFYDVSNPAAPKMLSQFTTPNRRANGEAESHTISFARYGDKFYLVTTGGTGIDTWDVTDVMAPKHLAQLKISGVNYGDYTEAVWGLSWQGQYIYVGATNNGVKVVDASDPASLSIAGQIPTSQYGGVSAGPLDAVGNVLVVLTPKENGGVATLDISDPIKPARLASLSADKSYIGQFFRHYAFLIGPIRVWDVLTNPKSIGTGSTPIGRLSNENAEYLSFSDDYLFLGHVRAEIGGTPGASKITVADPKNMKVVSRIWGRQNFNNKNDDQFSLAIGNLLVLTDDQAPYAGWVIAVHQAEPDTKPPVVDTVIPKDKSTDATATSRVGVTFSDNIEIATVNAASFIVRPVGGQALPGKYGVRMGVVNFDPDQDLVPGTTYEVVLPKGGIADLVGNTLADEWKSTFTVN